ncbi:MAG: 50S ribosomal protein L28 [Chloroflexota bacterium]
MAKMCDVCGKGVVFGRQVSKRKNKTNRPWSPNIQSARVLVDGKVQKLNVCTRCLRSGKVRRAV